MKRVKLKLEKPNRLFELWLEEWMKEAASRNSELQHHFSRALASLRKYPLPLESGKDCIILQHFGTKLCSMLDRKLKEHWKNPDFSSLGKEFTCKCTYKQEQLRLCHEQDAQQRTADDPIVTKEGIQEMLKGIGISAWSIENYSALFTLHTINEDLSHQGYVLETDVLSKMHGLYGMKSKESLLNLFSDGLVSMTGSPIRYSLTNQGIAIAKGICNLIATDVKLIRSVDKIREIQAHLRAIYSQDTGIMSGEHANAIATLPTLNKSKSPRKESSQSVNHAIVDTEHIGSETVTGKRKKPANQKSTSKRKVVDPVNAAVDNVEVEVNLQPDMFDILLLVDTHETSGGKTKPKHDATIVELSELGVLFEVRHLKVGDFAWIARCRYTRKELVLPYVVERKRIDDLSASIVDGRFHEQKFRLKQSGIANIMYIVECYDKTQRLTVPHSALMQASINSMVQDGFTLKYTKSHEDSMFHLSCVTRVLIREYKGKNLIGSKKEDLDQISMPDTSVRLMVFDEFNKAASKQKVWHEIPISLIRVHYLYRVFKVREMFVRQLLQLKGLSVDKALAIVEKYPTPQILIEAFNESAVNGEQMLANMNASDKKRAINATISKAVFELYTRKSLS